jgi:hypothetical protein
MRKARDETGTRKVRYGIGMRKVRDEIEMRKVRDEIGTRKVLEVSVKIVSGSVEIRKMKNLRDRRYETRNRDTRGAGKVIPYFRCEKVFNRQWALLSEVTLGTRQADDVNRYTLLFCCKTGLGYLRKTDHKNQMVALTVI